MTALGDILRQIRLPGEQTGYFAARGEQRQGFFTDQIDLPLPQDRDVWFSLNPGTTGYRTLPDGRQVPTNRVTRQTVTRLAALHADLDVGGRGKTIPSAEAAKGIVTDLSTMLGTPPIAVIASGHGYQPIWAIEPEAFAGDEATALLKRWGALVRGVAETYGGEVDSVFELARLVRAPGTINYKHDPVPATATMLPGRRLTIAEIVAVLDAHSPAPEPTASAMGAASGTYDGPKPEQATTYEINAVNAEIGRLKALPRPWHDGAGWDATIFAVATSLTEIANSSWATLTHEQVEQIIEQYAPYDEAWDGRRAKLESARRTAGGKQRPAPNQILGGPANDFVMRIAQQQGFMAAAPGTPAGLVPGQPGPAGQIVPADRTVDVSNPALAAKWLVETAGTGGLAGMFFRKGEVVHTAAMGEEGYVEVKDTRGTAAASITPMDARRVRARVTVTHDVQKLVEDAKATKAAQKDNPDAPTVWKPKPAIFPLESADILVQAPDLAPHLRDLRGVVHSPTFRPDGTLITVPGYDDATGLLFLPIGKQPDFVPEVPSAMDVEMAKKRLEYLLQDFAFVSEHDRASYLGLMLTPLLRTMLPPPYKLGVIEAHQPGSGKSFLARAIVSIHGGMEKSGLSPTDEELEKVVGAILDTQTAPVVVFDNVDGIVRSPLLAGLLTSPTFMARRLGSTATIEATNDRLWLMTANNATLSGDLGRRNIRVRIDPGVEHPEARSDFAIPDFEGFVREHRGELLWALLVLIRNWIVRGAPLPAEVAKDSYGRWIGSLRGILYTAGVPGNVDDPSTRDQAHDPEQEEHREFFEAIYAAFGSGAWTAKDLLAKVSSDLVEMDPLRPIPYGSLPGWLLGDRRAGAALTSLSRKLGNGLRVRKGRWYGGYRAVPVGESHKVAKWQIQRAGEAPPAATPSTQAAPSGAPSPYSV
jgi:hypothetical protein